VNKNKQDPAPDAVTSLQLTSDPEVDLDDDRVWLPFLGDTADICPLCEQGHMQPAWAHWPLPMMSFPVGQPTLYHALPL
jgi:hypothetical protein